MATVLIVDDNPDIRKLLSLFVESAGHNPVTAAAASQAWEKLEQMPDLVFLDIDMPGETGVDFLFRIRKEEKYTKIPVVFVTAYPDRCGPIQFSGEGADGVIPKPFKKEEIVETLDRILGE